MEKYLNDIFNYGVNIEKRKIYDELNDLFLSVLPSLESKYSFHIIDCNIDTNNEFAMYLHTPSKNNNPDIQTLLKTKDIPHTFFSEFKQEYSNDLCWDDVYFENPNDFISLFFSEELMKRLSDSRKNIINWIGNNDNYSNGIDLFVKFTFNKKYDNRYSFFSSFFPFRGNLIAFVISIDLDYYNSNSQYFSDDEYLNHPYPSFLLEVINNFFEKWKEIYYFGLFQNAYCMMTRQSILDLSAKDITLGRGLPSIEIFKELSSASYEGAPCYGQISFIDDECSHADNIIDFKIPINFTQDNIRLIRKLLELSKDNYFLNVSIKSFGRCYITGITNDTSFSLYTVLFTGRKQFRIVDRNQKELLCWHDNRMYYSDSMYEDIVNDVSHYLSCDKKLITKIVESATKQKHGTTVIIYKNPNDAIEECERLARHNRAISLNCKCDTSELIPLISSVDGALIFDENGMCYGFGVILDGVSCIEGNTSRGARYNSAYTYVQQKDCVALVFSEDGSVDKIFGNQN